LYDDVLQLYLHAEPGAINKAIFELNDNLRCILDWSSRFGAILTFFADGSRSSPDLIDCHLMLLWTIFSTEVLLAGGMFS
jgi:hypothetical protein